MSGLSGVCSRVPPFLPTDISNLIFWSEADFTEHTITDNRLVTWQDRSGVGQTLSRSGTGALLIPSDPEYGGKSTFNFDVDDTYYEDTTFVNGPTTGDSDFSFIFVGEIRRRESDADSFIFELANSAGTFNSGLSAYYRGTPNWRLRFRHRVTGGSLIDTQYGLAVPIFPAIIVGTYTAGTAKLYLNGVEIVSGTPAALNANIARMRIGGSFSTERFFGKMAMLAMWQKELTANEIDLLFASASRKYKLPVWGLVSRYIILDGDSITNGNELASNLGKLRLHDRVYHHLGQPRNVIVKNDGVGSATLLTMDSDAVSTIDNASLPPKAGKNGTIIIIFGGTNDLSGGADADTAYSRLRTYIQNRKAAGFNNIVVATSIPRTTITDAKIFPYNDLIRDNWSQLQSDGASHLIDLQTLAEFDHSNDVDNLDFYNSDKVHPNAEGTDKIGMKFAEILMTFI